jgi:hypothetical protein
MAKVKKHALGGGNGKMLEYDDGTAAYVPFGSFSQSFRVKISDVTGFSVTKGHKVLERTLNVNGNGTVLASTSVNHGASEKIEQWFRRHPKFSKAAPVAAGSAPLPPAAPPLSSPMIADELRKLGELKAEGIITDQEFAAAKARLLDR